ncbi:hypothetical protein UFOVP178_54 [uncultured Caudovirales phage]|uniref:Uncharacterized protein n=1 Tax=uncultured Caudovirales phage TaxID=2100421 RepID=A0A6J7WCE4_9CAUD|nr:hypothetical protein UFOVP178_54 [uncultured Caudovirales phage]
MAKHKGKSKVINGVTYWAASTCKDFLGTDYTGLRRMARKFGWRKFQLPISPIVFYAADDVKKVYEMSQTVEKFVRSVDDKS